MKRPHTSIYWLAIAAAVGLVIGSIGPWVSVLGLSDSGLEKDGVITLPAALGAIAALIHHDRRGTRAGLIAALALFVTSLMLFLRHRREAAAAPAAPGA